MISNWLFVNSYQFSFAKPLSAIQNNVSFGDVALKEKEYKVSKGLVKLRKTIFANIIFFRLKNKRFIHNIFDTSGEN